MNRYKTIIDAVSMREDMEYLTQCGDLIVKTKDMVMIFSAIGCRNTIVAAYMSNEVCDKMFADMNDMIDNLKNNGAVNIESPAALFAFTYGYGASEIIFKEDDFDLNYICMYQLHYNGNTIHKIGDPNQKIVYLIQTDNGHVTKSVFSNLKAAIEAVWQFAENYGSFADDWIDEFTIQPIAIDSMNMN